MNILIMIISFDTLTHAFYREAKGDCTPKLNPRNWKTK
jgi:hypothetical protein